MAGHITSGDCFTSLQEVADHPVKDLHSGPGSSVSPTKAIGSLARKQSDVTRQGSQKLKFVPTLPTRRKEEVKVEPILQEVSSVTGRGAGRGRGRGDGRGRGRSGGAPRAEFEMTASGPFSMGPALVGNNRRQAVLRPTSALPPRPRLGVSSESILAHNTPPSLKSESDNNAEATASNLDAAEEAYSEPDEGVEIVDMKDVHQMDWMAPESLRKEPHRKKRTRDSGVGSESEEEEEMEDIIEDFAAKGGARQNSPLRGERLYFFQFPAPFPSFTPKNISSTPPLGDTFLVDDTIDDDVAGIRAEAGALKDSAPESKPSFPGQKSDGIIGKLVVYRSGTVKMKLTNGIVLDVNAATHPSFLQQTVYLDMANKRLVVLGEVNKAFLVSPDVETLLSAMELSDGSLSTPLSGEGNNLK